MARTDTYTAAQAAQLLGVSERRVRQLVNEGKLAGDRGADGTVRVAQQAVNEERKRRRTKEVRPATKGTTRRGLAGQAVDVEQLADQVANAVGIKLQGQLEITRQAESLIRGELDEERARRVEAEAKSETAAAALAAATARIAELEASIHDATARKGLFRRR
jgi:excisionase family DNA binding protein